MQRQEQGGNANLASASNLMISPFGPSAGGLRKRQPTVRYQYKEKTEFVSVNCREDLDDTVLEDTTQIYQNNFVSNFASKFEQFTTAQIVPIDGRKKSVILQNTPILRRRTTQKVATFGGEVPHQD